MTIEMPIGRAAGDAGAVVRVAHSVLSGNGADLAAARLASASGGRQAQCVSVELHTMDDDEIDAYLQRSRTNYVNELVTSGMSEAAAAARADDQQSQAFRDGRAAPGHHVRAVVENDRTIGYVWYGPEADASDDRWWLWDIWVNGSDRGRGVGGEVLALVEAEVRRLHGTSLGLSVLGSNDRARRLYERSGYEVVTARMRKLL